MSGIRAWGNESGIHMDKSERCLVCTKPCYRLDINFEAPVHSGECLDSLWKEYLATLNG